MTKTTKQKSAVRKWREKKRLREESSKQSDPVWSAIEERLASPIASVEPQPIPDSAESIAHNWFILFDHTPLIITDYSWLSPREAKPEKVIDDEPEITDQDIQNILSTTKELSNKYKDHMWESLREFIALEAALTEVRSEVKLVLGTDIEFPYEQLRRSVRDGLVAKHLTYIGQRMGLSAEQVEVYIKGRIDEAVAAKRPSTSPIK